MNRKIKVLVVLEPEASRDIEFIVQAIGRGALEGYELAGVLLHGGMVVETARKNSVDVVILSPKVPGYRPEIITQLYHNPEKPIAVIGYVPPWDEARREEMERWGARGVLDAPFSTSEDVSRLAEIVPGAISTLWEERKSPFYIPSIPPEKARHLGKHGWQRMAVAVWGAGGGVGKTVVATNLAVALAAIGGRNVLLTDLDMNKASAHNLLDLPMDQYNVFALAQRYNLERARFDGKLTPDLLKGYTKTVRLGRSPVPLSFLAGIPQSWMSGLKELQGESGSAFVEALVKAGKEIFDFVIMDLGQSLVDPVHWAALRMSDRILAITTPARTSVAALKQSLETISQASPSSKIWVVVNMYHEMQGVTQGDIQKALGANYPVMVMIPRSEEEACIRSINKGHPLVLMAPQDPASKGLLALATLIYPPLKEVLETEKKPLLNKLREVIGV